MELQQDKTKRKPQSTLLFALMIGTLFFSCLFRQCDHQDTLIVRYAMFGATMLCCVAYIAINSFQKGPWWRSLLMAGYGILVAWTYWPLLQQ